MSSHNTNDPILDAVARLVARVGEDFTMNQLSSETGLSRATLYRRVQGREALVARLKVQGNPLGKDLRTRILTAAHAVFSNQGFLGGNMEAVAEEAGIGVATVYRHFGDKDSLVRAVVDHIVPKGLLRQISLTPSEDVRADLEQLARAAIRAIYELRGLLRLSIFGSEAERSYLERVRQGTERTGAMLTRYFAAQMVAGRFYLLGEPEELALAFSGLLFAFAVLGPTRSGTALEQPDQKADLIVSIFLDGLRVKEDSREQR
jgi:AcrR family transcriptional regulator